MLNVDTLLNIFNFIPKISKLRLVCKLWHQLLPYKIIKLYKSEEINSSVIKYSINDNSIYITIDFKSIVLTGTFLEMFDELTNISKYYIKNMKYETNFKPKLIEESVNKSTNNKTSVISNSMYKVLLRIAENQKYEYEIFIPLVIHDSMIYDFKFFKLECRDILPNEFKAIAIRIRNNRSDKKLEHDINYYKITRDLINLVFNNIVFDYLPKVKATDYNKYYRRLNYNNCLQNTKILIKRFTYIY